MKIYQQVSLWINNAPERILEESFSPAPWHRNIKIACWQGGNSSHFLRIWTLGIVEGWSSVGRLNEEGWLSTSRQFWEGGVAQRAAAWSSSSLKQQLRATMHALGSGAGSKAGQQRCRTQVMSESMGWPVKLSHWTLYAYLCIHVCMEQGGTTGLWLQESPSSLARHGVEASVVDVIYLDVRLCPMFQFLPQTAIHI